MTERSRLVDLLSGLSPLRRDEFLAEAVEIAWSLLAMHEALQALT